MSRVTTQPDLKNSLRFCCFLLDEEESLHRNDNETWAREAKAHRFNLIQLLKFIETESEEVKMKVHFSKKGTPVSNEEFSKALDKAVRESGIFELLERIKTQAREFDIRMSIRPVEPYFGRTDKTDFQDAIFHTANGKGKK